MQKYTSAPDSLSHCVYQKLGMNSDLKTVNPNYPKLSLVLHKKLMITNYVVKDKTHLGRRGPHRFIWLLSVVLLILFQTRSCSGGNCWTGMNNNGKCSALYKLGATREECCGDGSFLANSVTASYSEGEMSSSSIFYMHIQGGVPCTKCKETCDNVRCPNNRKCAVRNGQPKCVCAPDCTAFRLENGLKTEGRGPVCGTDGQTYKNICRLLKRSCRQGMLISIAYTGPCKMSCSKVTCRGTKKCLVDQNQIPHCVNCPERICPTGDDDRSKPGPRPVCGTDGLTYSSVCKLRQTACFNGKAIPVAYKGVCKRKASCDTVRCSQDQSCLTDPVTGKPRCVTCTKSRWWCRKYQREQNFVGPICSTNGKTYKSWCEMQDEACATLIALDTKHFGDCKSRNTNNSIEYD